MAEFLVKVADERGRVSEQVERGTSEGEVRDRFAQQGLLVYSVKSRGMLAGGAVQFGRRKLNLEQFVLFNQQFVTLIKAGLPILTALDILSRRQRNEYLRAMLTDVRERVRTGQSLSDAFAVQGTLPKIYTTTILSGEKSGNLEGVLERFISFQRVTLSFRKKLKAALIYPALLLIMVTGMLAFLITYVVPKFADLYGQLEAQLPYMTVLMMKIGQNAAAYFPVVIVVVIGGGFLLWRWARTGSGKAAIDRVRLKAPLLGEIWVKYQVAMFARSLSTLLSGGLPLVPALETAGQSMESPTIAANLTRAAQAVREGRSLHGSLEEVRTFPDLAIEMIEVGESTGALPAMLNSVAEFYEEDVQNALSAAMSLVEPVILIFMAVIVGFVLISLYLPIFSIGASGSLAR